MSSDKVTFYSWFERLKPMTQRCRCKDHNTTSFSIFHAATSQSHRGPSFNEIFIQFLNNVIPTGARFPMTDKQLNIKMLVLLGFDLIVASIAPKPVFDSSPCFLLYIKLNISSTSLHICTVKNDSFIRNEGEAKQFHPSACLSLSSSR